jgi:hypothetical protein
MGISVNLYSNGQIVPTKNYRKRFDKMKWGPGHIQRDKFGIPLSIKNKDSDKLEKEARHANLQKRFDK